MVNNNSLGRNMRRDESNTNSPFTLPASWREPHVDWLAALGGKCPAEDIPPPSQDTSAGFGHLSCLLALVNHAVFLCSYKPHLQSDKLPAELGTRFPYCREEINSSLRGMVVFNLHGLDTIPKFKLGKMLIFCKALLQQKQLYKWNLIKTINLIFFSEILKPLCSVLSNTRKKKSK